jgi:hypothetical protein
MSRENDNDPINPGTENDKDIAGRIMPVSLKIAKNAPGRRSKRCRKVRLLPAPENDRKNSDASGRNKQDGNLKRDRKSTSDD